MCQNGIFYKRADENALNGNVSIEEYLDWVSKVEKFFDYMGTVDDKQVCLVAYKLKGGASA